ncbi:MAG TPA: FAD:protein FMN transferase [Steroidobacteraceae bacterium]|nr:FAD:protein FMN transferase [Steroidobacteraceae bacterium]
MYDSNFIDRGCKGVIRLDKSTLYGDGRRVGCALLLAGAVLALPAHAEWIYREAPIMGTRCDVELWSEDQAKGEAAIASVFEDMRRFDESMSTYKPTSEVSYVNAHAAQGPVKISSELYDLADKALQYSEITRGTFDITYASVGYLYDYRNRVRPNDATITAKLPAINYRHVHLDKAASTIRFDYPGVRIDFGGLKGYEVDRGIELLRVAGFTHAMVNAGGDTRIIGDRFGKPWIVGIRDPDDRSKIVLRMPITDAALSTSGDYERYFDEGGVRYYHILDPKTGKSPHKVRSVTIIGPNATRTDALTKSVFVMGAKEGIAFIDTLPDVDAVVITPDGKIWYSQGLEQPK